MKKTIATALALCGLSLSGFAQFPVSVTFDDDVKTGFVSEEECPWTPLQFGVFPGPQIFDSKTDVYGIAADILLMKQKRVYGIAVAPLNGVKESAGIKIGAISSVCEQNDGLSIGALLDATRRNRGVTIGLITLTNENEGLQIGLINICTSSKRIPILPLLSFPFESLFFKESPQ